MKALRTSYNNTGAWKFIEASDSKVLLVYNHAMLIWMGLIIALFSLGLSMWGYSAYHGQKEAILFLLFGGGIAFFAVLLSITHGLSEKKKGPLLSYCKQSDVLEFLQLDLRVEQALQSLTFSYEEYRALKGAKNVELNFIHNNTRRPFLSYLGVSGQINKVKAGLLRLGFKVVEYREEE